jgi:hypothetical protein
LAHWHDFALFRWRRCTVPRPRIHQPAALFEQITAPIGGLNLVAFGVRERRFGKRIRK